MRRRRLARLGRRRRPGPPPTERSPKASARALAERRGSATHLVLVSSAMVYGAWANNPVPITEEAVLRPDVEFVYARQLGSVEQLADEWRLAVPGRTVTVLRPAVAMAADGTRGLAAALAAGMGHASARTTHRPSSSTSTISPSAVVLAAEQRLDGVYNVAPDGWVAGERVRALAGAVPRLRAAGSAGRGHRQHALAVPAWPDPARPAQLHPVAVAGGQRSD